MTARTNDDGPADPDDLSQWGLHCYCPTARRTPHSVVADGSNGRLLHAARAGATVEALRLQGLTVGEEQIATLVEHGLLAVDGEWLRTAFPVIGRADITAVRSHLTSLGRGLADELTPLVGRLRGVLADDGLERSLYAAVFGYALDGLLWERLAGIGAVPDVTLSDARPWWNGAFWAVHPARESAAGTNFLDCGGATLVQVWTDSTVAALNALTAAPGVRAAVRHLAGLAPEDALGSADGAVVDGTGTTWRLRQPDGRPAIPVTGADGPVDRIAGKIAAAVAEALVGEQATTARATIPSDDPAVATVVMAHELIWDVTEALVASGAMSLPAGVSSGAAAGPPLDLLYVELSRP